MHDWAVAFLATLTYGAIVVPILHEFKAEQVHNIVNHSDARLLFAGDMVWPTLDAEAMPQLEGIVHIPRFHAAHQPQRSPDRSSRALE